VKINLVIILNSSILAANTNAGICGFAPAFFKILKHETHIPLDWRETRRVVVIRWLSILYVTTNNVKGFVSTAGKNSAKNISASTFHSPYFQGFVV